MASSLPTELLSLIFLFAHEEQYRNGTHVENAGNKTAPEVTFTRVCSSWRRIALTLSHLWSTFQYIKNPDLPNTHVARFSEYLARSGTQLLDIRLDLRRGSAADHPSPDDYTLLQATIQQQARWKRFSILFNNRQSAVEYEELLANANAPYLKYFTFCAMPVYHLRSRGSRRVSIPVALTRHLPHYTFFNGTTAPVLQSIRLDASTFISNAFPRAAYSNLHTLRIDDNSDAMHESPVVRLDKLKEVLKIPCLRNLSISNMRIEDPPADNILGPLLTMTALKDFRCGSPSIVKLLKHIDTPALKSMVLKRTPFPILRITSVALKKLVLIACYDIPWAHLSQECSYITAGIEQLTVFEVARFIPERSHSDFDYALKLWPNLTYLGCHIPENSYNLNHESPLTFFISFAQNRTPNTLTLEIPSSLLDYWQAKVPQSLNYLRELCDLQRWEDGKPLIPLHWPYQEDADISFGHDLNDYDPFRLLWQNSMYVGDVPRRN